MVLEWTDPPFTPGHWVPDMVAAAGGVPVLGAAGGRSVRTTWDAVAAAAPSVVVAAPCGFGLDDSARLAAEALAAGLLPGVPLWAVDANASFARPGPRLVDGVEALAAILHPAAGVPLDEAARPPGVSALTERVQGGHVVGGQLEAGDVGVGPDPLLLGRLRDHHDAVLEVPADDHLGRRCGPSRSAMPVITGCSRVPPRRAL